MELYTSELTNIRKKLPSIGKSQMSIQYLKNNFEKANYLASMLSAQACGSKGDEKEYTTLRNELLSIPNAEQLVPGFVRTNRTLDAFWRFIQQKYPTYAERRTFVSEQFTPLLDYLEFSENGTPSLPTPTPQ